MSVQSSGETACEVSVVVPSYNHGEFVGQTLRSIFKQTSPPGELIVIDDGSTDDSPQILAEVLNECPFPCELLIRENRGLCRTLNEALDRSKGKYFAYLGSDDLWFPNFLKGKLELLQSHPTAILAYGRLYTIDRNNEIIGEPFHIEASRDLCTRDRLLYGFAPTSSAILYRKRFLLEQRWNPDIKLEDYDLFLRLCMSGDFVFDDRVDAAWRLHETNTSSDYEFMIAETVAAIERNADVLGLSDEEVRRITISRKIGMIDKYLTDHKRAQAFRLFFKHLGGFPGKTVLVKKAIKILTPTSITALRTRHLLDRMLVRGNTYINDDFEVARITDERRLRKPLVRPKRHLG
jgi:alpha-1,3-rhamnosyltransferase